MVISVAAESDRFESPEPIKHRARSPRAVAAILLGQRSPTLEVGEVIRVRPVVGHGEPVRACRVVEQGVDEHQIENRKFEALGSNQVGDHAEVWPTNALVDSWPDSSDHRRVRPLCLGGRRQRRTPPGLPRRPSQKRCLALVLGSTITIVWVPAAARER